MTTRLTRRQFVQASAALGTTLLASTKAVRKARAVGPNDEIRTAIIGINGQGKNHIGYHVRAEGRAHRHALRH